MCNVHFHRKKEKGNINLRKVNLKPYGFDKMYMGKELTEHELYQIIDQFNERKSFIQYSKTKQIHFMM